MSTRAEQSRTTSAMLLAAALVALATFHVVRRLGSLHLDLGSLNVPTPGYVDLALLWMVCGGAAAALLTLAVSRYPDASARIASLAARFDLLPDTRFAAWMCVAAFAIPVSIRVWLLRGAPLADDESAYRFAAQLLASWRLWVPSPRLKLFFDQNFMINDGRLYPVYFLGWPALLAPGTWFNAAGLVNPLLSTATVPALIGTLRYFVGRRWARAGAVLFLSAPFIQIAAATELSHTSCLMALTWSLYMYVRSREPDASMRHHAGFAFFLALAFCIRPQSAVALAVPLVIAWTLGLRRFEPASRARAVLAFAVPAVLMAALFLTSLWLQNGSPWLIGYTRYNRYIAENGYRFTTFRASDLTAIAGFDFSQAWPALQRTADGLFRLNFDLYGWPSSFALLAFAAAAWRRTRVLWAMAGWFVLAMFFQLDWGIDTFGPVHAFELALPLLILTMAGAESLAARTVSPVAPALFASLIMTAWAGFVPIRFDAVAQIAAHINRALDAPQQAGLHRAVIFAPFPITASCDSTPRHFVFFHPTNDPDLTSDILWVNHLNPQLDRDLLEDFPGRAGYVLVWTKPCDARLLKLPPG